MARPRGEIEPASASASIAGVCLAAAVVLGGCATRVDAPNATTAPLPGLKRSDMLWLARTSFGLDSASVASYRSLGREVFLERQLRPSDAGLPEPIAAIGGGGSHSSACNNQSGHGAGGASTAATRSPSAIR